MVCHLPQLVEMDLNPVLVDADDALVLDARMVIDGTLPAQPDDRYRHLAIHPYPDEWCSSYPAGNREVLAVRPIRPEDAALEARFIADLSSRSRYFRFLSAFREANAETIARFTQIDYDREMAFVAQCGVGDAARIVGVGRYVTDAGRAGCEFAVVVTDEWQGLGLGRYLIERLLKHAGTRGIERFWGLVAAGNQKMLELMDEVGFEREAEADDPGMLQVVKRLRR
jgi:acetyltransferase